MQNNSGNAGHSLPVPTLADIQEFLTERGPLGIAASNPRWLSSFTVNERKVDKYYEGRVLLAGDAARRVGEAVDVLRRALRERAFALTGEAGDRPVRTAVVQRIAAAREVAQADVADPVAIVRIDRRDEVIRVIVADADLVDPLRRDDPRLADREVAALLRIVRQVERGRLELAAVVHH